MGGLDADKRRRGAAGAAKVVQEERRRRGFRARDRGQHVAAANENRAGHKDGCSVLFFRRKQDAVQERHTVGLLSLVGRAARHPGDSWSGGSTAGLLVACLPAQRKVQPSPAQPSRVELSRVGSGRGESSRVVSAISLDPRF